MIFNIVQWGEEITVEKSYSDFMHEISADDLYRGLLAHGLFAEKLPPIFTSESFFNIARKKISLLMEKRIVMFIMKTCAISISPGHWQFPILFHTNCNVKC